MSSDISIVYALPDHVENERHWRLLMDSASQPQAKEILISSVERRFAQAPASPALFYQALEWAFKIKYQHGSVPSSIYLNHPLRVANILAQELDVPDDETLAIAVLHNVLEVSEVSKKDLSDMLGKNIAEAIDALTVDRARQDDVAYKNEYYAHIEATSPACARVKIADKLDNIYMLCFNPSEKIRENYLDEIDLRVVPMAERVMPALAKRLNAASAVMRKTGFLDKKTELERAKRKNL